MHWEYTAALVLFRARISKGTVLAAMNVGLFGGTFDPIHRGHLALARAASGAYALGRVYFVPANIPPHKQRYTLASYFDRYAMVALAISIEKTFVPSLLEAPEAAPRENYTIDTIRRLKPRLKKSDKLFLLIGIDAFKDIAKWRESEAIFRECEFIVASRPGFSLADVATSLPEKLRPAPAVIKPFAKHSAKGDLVLPGVTVHLLDHVDEKVSATAIRDAVRAKKPLGKLVDPAVAEYIRKRELYKNR
jgi:nicotinate-nucleotide adenylyltransferase